MERKKLVFSLETPYSTALWPDLSLEKQETILELLCSLVSPLGDYRRRFVTPSKGKRDKRRNRKREDSNGEMQTDIPPPPELSSFVDVGLASISRALENLSCEEEDAFKNTKKLDSSGDSEPSQTRYYSVIFVAGAGKSSSWSSSGSSPMNWHFPQIVSTASLAHPAKPPIHLVGFSRNIAEDKLSDALGIPRVSCLALCEGCPQSNTLLEFIHEHVPLVDVPWLQDAKAGTFKPTKIKAAEASVGPRKGTRATLPIYPSK